MGNQIIVIKYKYLVKRQRFLEVLSTLF